MPDAGDFGDDGAHTLDHLIDAAGGLDADDVRTEVCQQHARELAAVVGQVQHAIGVEHPCPPGE